MPGPMSQLFAVALLNGLDLQSDEAGINAAQGETASHEPEVRMAARSPHLNECLRVSLMVGIQPRLENVPS